MVVTDINLDEFRNNLLCRRESNQRKSRLEWNHYLLGEISVSEFGECFKEFKNKIIDEQRQSSI